ncbi:MAG: hypothetical protein RI531_04115 [Haloferacaceae archaeon]|jgi:Uncharacterized membrane-associated protein/domain|nr:hypothetical protein [Haloferacaceae archaeon]
MTRRWGVRSVLMITLIGAVLSAGVAGAPMPAQLTAEDATVADPLTTVEIDLQTDGSAQWTVEMTVPLRSEAEQAAFERLITEYEEGSDTVGPQEQMFRQMATEAAVVTGRQMQITAVERSGRVSTDEGTLVLRFAWSAFTSSGTDGGFELRDVFGVAAGDQELTESWVSLTDASQQIIIYPPAGYTVAETSIAVQQQEGAIVINRAIDLTTGENRLAVEYQQAGVIQTGGWWIMVGVLGVLIGLVAVLYLRREGRLGRGDAPAPDEGPAPPSTDEETDLSLLSDEERVERLLRASGGRMRQAAIVDATGWSDAKVSQLLSEMAESGRVQKLRLGRENLISLPEED